MKKMLDRPLVFLSLFLAMVFAGDRLIASVIGSVIDRSQFRFSRMYRGDASADIVIFGDSRAVHSFYAPGLGESLGVKVFNLGYNGFSTEMIECLVHDYLEHSPPPKLIVLEVTNAMQTPDSLGNLKPYLRHSPLLTTLFRRERPAEYIATTISHMYRLNCELSLRVIYFFRQSDQSWILTNSISPELSSPNRAAEAESETINNSYVEKNLAAFDRIVCLAHDKGVEIKLVVAPYWPEQFKRSKKRQHVIQQIKERFQVNPCNPHSCGVWDYSVLLDRSEYFADRKHLNRAGADQMRMRMQADVFFESGSLPPEG